MCIRMEYEKKFESKMEWKECKSKWNKRSGLLYFSFLIIFQTVDLESGSEGEGEGEVDAVVDVEKELVSFVALIILENWKKKQEKRREWELEAGPS